MVIKKEGTNYNLYSYSTGKRLGSFKSKEAAVIRERQIAYFKKLKLRKGL